MTLPYERHRAVINAREFLVQLCCGEIARIPKEVRERARRLLKHYPSPLDLDFAAQQAPDVFMRTAEEWRERTFGSGVPGAGGT
jgi:hypothetical protein